MSGALGPAPDLPRSPGAYALLISLTRRTRLEISTLNEPVLAAGRYVYCGSARGPGGLAARVGRHLRRDKKRHWHVDHLTDAGRVLDVCCLADCLADCLDRGGECAMVRSLRQIPGVTVPVMGFGSSDCGRCAAHLLKVPIDFTLSPQLFQ